jgi:NADH dehydrogenase (ubiquinone) flavoprotein 2
MQPFAPPAEDLRQREACHLESMGGPARFSPESLAELEETQKRYPTLQASLLPALWIAQREFGWISREVIEEVARLCQVPPSHVYGVVSFYTMYNRSPRGKYHLQLCTNLSCQLRGTEHILDCLRTKLGIDLGETTADRLFTLEEVECLAACEMAPVLQVNDEFIGPMTVESTEALLEKLRGRGGAA